MLIGAIHVSAESRLRATYRLIPLFLANRLTDAEETDIANALWGDSDPVAQNPGYGGSLFDWVYLVLPEPEDGNAERSFRTKWLTPKSSDQDRDAIYSSSMLSQLCAAVTGLKMRNKCFQLSDAEQAHVIDHIERLIHMFSSGQVKMSFGFNSRIRDLGSLVGLITIENEVGEQWLLKVDTLLQPPTTPMNSFIKPLIDMRIALGYALVPFLIKTKPHESEKIFDWIARGVASSDEAMNREAIAALSTWISASIHEGLPSVPSDLVRQVGAIISSGRGSGLGDALMFAERVFDKGSSTYRGVISPFALIGLNHLAEKLRYDTPQPEDINNLHTLRLLCVRLARKMAHRGFDGDAIVNTWLEIGKNDPFPETRYASIVEDRNNSPSN